MTEVKIGNSKGKRLTTQELEEIRDDSLLVPKESEEPTIRYKIPSLIEGEVIILQKRKQHKNNNHRNNKKKRTLTTAQTNLFTGKTINHITTHTEFVSQATLSKEGIGEITHIPKETSSKKTSKKRKKIDDSEITLFNRTTIHNWRVWAGIQPTLNQLFAKAEKNQHARDELP